ncbi:unnamed protein product [Paramecium sonneborni]|uniref:PB1 domain-containing protein n=1 Tax=Paramecium sonneborni TaxID=65129 RepID=A0A8S1MXS5_9CILI|nr:unnamed protein product [Paramecium sonneborni]
MDLKIQTQSQTFQIYIQNLTIRDLKSELKRLRILLKDIVLYFYDSDCDKIVIIDDKDIQYAFEQGKQRKRNIIKFYIYYQLKVAKINKTNILNKKSIEQITSDDSEIINKSPVSNQSYQLPSAIFQTREQKLQIVIENYMDKLLSEMYEI